MNSPPQVKERRLKILVSCYACDPELGSEPGMGGNWVVQLARHHDLWVLTEANRFAPALINYIDRHCPELKSAIHVTGIPRRRFGESLWQHFFYYWTYRRWQKDALREARALQHQIAFDLVHQLNMIGYREPGYLWQLQLPFIWGPIGGHAQMPWRFLFALGLRGGLQCGIRNVLNWLQMRGSWRVKQAVKQATVLLAATREDQAAIRRLHSREALLLNEQGANPIPTDASRDLYNGQRPLRIVWCGVFVPRKALPLALKVTQLVARETSVELHIVGAGPMERAWKTLAERLGVTALCRWHGMLPRSESLGIIRQSDLLLFTSLQEGTPAVVLEAIQSGVPVICHDLCGFGTIVTEMSGVKIPVEGPERSCRAFADAVVRVAQAPELLHRLSEGALQRANEIAWPNQTKVMLDCYRKAMRLPSFQTKEYAL